ncbi:hypothetical protein C8R46DRAFT_885532 [Mycena filopes]|nr:hypothetical protein C8R46DRAFT_885532 [Mycena filopes]
MAGHTNNARTSNRGAVAGSSRLTAPQISQANTGRQNAISAHFPPTPHLVARGKRRGPAVHPPTLARGPPPTLLETVSFIDPATGTRVIRVKFEVLPHSVRSRSSSIFGCSLISLQTLPNNDFVLCRRLRTSELGFLEQHNLLYTFVLPETTTVVELIRMGASAMQDGPGKFKFDTDTGTRASRLLPHEILPLQLLSLVNKGNPRANGVSYLTSRHPVTLNMTIGEFTAPAMRSKFGHPSLCVEDMPDGAHLIIRAGTTAESSHFTSLNLPFHLPGIRRPGARFASSGDTESWPRSHSCLSTRYVQLIDEAMEGDFEESDFTETITSGGEPESGSDEEENVADALMPMADFGMPDKLWARPFTPASGPYRAIWEAPNVLRAFHNIASAGSGNLPRRFDVRGVDLDSMSASYKKVLSEAVDSGDCTIVFAPVRNVRRTHADGSTLSVGAGVEREVLYHLAQTYFSNPDRYFLLRSDGRYTISTTISMSQRFLVSPARIRDLKILGLVLVLMLLNGVPPDPISPALFQLAFHNSFDALTPNFIQEWYPELHLVAQQWIQGGPTGSLVPFRSHLASNLDMQVACLEGRDQAQHDALAVDLVYNGSISNQPPSHPEIKAVIWGITAPCQSGFNAAEFFRSYPGGTERLLSEKWTSHITSYSSIEDSLDISCPSPTAMAPLMAGVSVAIDPPSILRDFLQRSGLTSRVRYEKAKPTFHPIVPTSKIDSPAFRPSMLAWGCGGTPTFDPDNTLFVGFSPPGCVEYHPDAFQRQVSMANGTVIFRSCLRSARIPLSYLIDLHRASYPAIDEAGNPTAPLTLEDAIDDWLLTEILGSIGDLSIL